MKTALCTLTLALVGVAMPSQAAEGSAAAKPAATTAASAPAAKTTTSKPGGAAPAAGGNGGSVSTNGSNLSTQVGPKKPKCPDPASTACPAEKVVGK
ncbi:hypothetical protein J2X20_002566 [Pelomonas saccharophila]|uniref:Uncharacterized protein n=1 Tax=Roseateles saccharophilus TaxID=304 RepID=A0ABU1YME3_ROSSA|nr:hypothetical protein [Roseateles saccharophilus]MDR7269908.1 hypothetical protein [Roseateles saccharophilus]